MVENKDLTFVIQGDRRRRICKCVAKIRKYFPNSHIIFSTWAGTDVSDIDCDEAVFSIDPGDSGDVYAPDNVENLSHKNNLNRQIVSSYNGLLHVNTKYAIKFRPDFILESDKIWKIYCEFEDLNLDIDLNYKMFDHRIFMFCPASAQKTNLAYHICDYVQIGYTEDLVELWRIPLITEEDSQYCVIHGIRQTECPRAYKYACEQQIWLRNIEKSKIKYKKNSLYNDIDEEIIEDSHKIFINNLYCLDYRVCDITSPFDWLRGFFQCWAYTFTDYYNWYTQYVGYSESLENFYKKYQKDIEQKYKIKETKTKIKSKDVSVVVQGPAEKGIINKCIKSIRKQLPFSEIILSTWEGSDVKNLDYNKLVLNKDPGNFPLTLNGLNNNVNRQIVSTLNGIKQATKKYCLKIRSNAVLKDNNFLNLLNQCTKYEDGYHLLQHRLLIPSYFSRDPNIYKKGIYANKYMKINYPFHPSDMVLFGLTSDMIDYWDIPLLKEQDVKVSFKGIYGKYIPEQYIFIKFLEKKGIKVNLSAYDDNSQENISLTEHLFASNFILVNYRTFGIDFQTEKFSIYQNPKRFLSCYTPYKWKALYNKYCTTNIFKGFFDKDILYIKLCLEIKKIRSLFVKKEKKKQDKSNIIKNTILMPTYKGHFKFVKKFLKSADKFLLDKDSTEIVFVINKNEDKYFSEITKKYKTKLRIRTIFFDDILKNNKILETPEQLLEHYGRFTFQTLKKLYAMLFLDREDYLVLDSESLFVKKTNLEQLKQGFFKKPYLIVSSIDDIRRNKAFMTFCENIDNLINIHVNKWPLEHFVWFYKTAILKDMVKDHGSFIEMAKKIWNLNSQETSERVVLPKDIRYGIFEIVLYLSYILKNNVKYKYQIKSVEELLSRCLSKQEKDLYIDDFYNNFKGNCGVLEHAILLLNKNRWKNLAQLFKDLQIKILRCDRTDAKLYPLQKKFLNIVQPCILASSQGHCFGLNNTLKNRVQLMLWASKTFEKLKKHVRNFITPIKKICKWCVEPFSIVFYFIKFLLDIVRHLKIVLLG